MVFDYCEKDGIMDSLIYLLQVSLVSISRNDIIGSHSLFIFSSLDIANYLQNDCMNLHSEQ